MAIRFKLRTLMLVVTALCIVLVIVLTATSKWRRRGLISAELKAMGIDYVGFNDDADVTWVSISGRLKSANLDRYPSISVVDMSGSRARDEDIRLITSLPNLQTLDLSRTRISNDAVVFLSEVKSLTVLRLNDTPVTDECVTAIANIPRLKGVDITGTRISPDGIARLRNRRSDINIRY